MQALDPTLEQSYYVGSWVLVQNDRVFEGIEMAERGVRENPDSGLLITNLAQVLMLYGDDLPAAYDMADTADGREKTPVASARRLARMVGCDLEDATESQWHRLALAVRAQQLTLLETALQRLLSRTDLNEKAPLVGAGAGTFLVRELARRAGRNYVDVSQLLPHAHADWATICFPAYAVAWLAGQQS